jgi:hypothetical protein
MAGMMSVSAGRTRSSAVGLFWILLESLTTASHISVLPSALKILFWCTLGNIVCFSEIVDLLGYIMQTLGIPGSYSSLSRGKNASIKKYEFLRIFTWRSASALDDVARFSADRQVCSLALLWHFRSGVFSFVNMSHFHFQATVNSFLFKKLFSSRNFCFLADVFICWLSQRFSLCFSFSRRF